LGRNRDVFWEVSKQFESILNVPEDTSNIGFGILLRGQLELMRNMIQISRGTIVKKSSEILFGSRSIISTKLHGKHIGSSKIYLLIKKNI
jgi:hypothetical protein